MVTCTIDMMHVVSNRSPLLTLKYIGFFRELTRLGRCFPGEMVEDLFQLNFADDDFATGDSDVTVNTKFFLHTMNIYLVYLCY